MITREDVGKFSQSILARSRAILRATVPYLRTTRDLGWGCLVTFGAALAAFGRYILSGRKLWLFLTEVIGVVLVTFGISFWSIPAAIIIGGLVLIAVIEVRPVPGPKFPEIPVPIEALRIQAERAAEAINNERFGLAMVDPVAFEKLSATDCERIITFARNIGAKRT